MDIDDPDLDAALARLDEGYLSPRAKGEKYRTNAVLWVYRWGFSSASILQRLTGRTSGGFAAGLVDRGLLKTSKTTCGFPKLIYTLTRTGLELAEYHAANRQSYRELDSSRVNQNQLRHDLIAQRFAVEHVRAGGGVRSPREMGVAGARNKQPDALLGRTALEVELSGKWDRILDMFFVQTIESIEEKRFDQVLIAAESPAILTRYRRRLAGPTIPIWRKNMAGLWWPSGEELKTSPYIDRFLFKLL